MKHMRLTIRHWMLGLMALTCSAALSAAPANFATTAPVGYWLGLETVTTHTGGELEGQTTYRVYMNMLNETDYLSACTGDSDNPLILESSSGTWYNNPYNPGWSAQGINPLFLPVFPDLAFDSFLTIGAEDATTPAAQHPSAIWGELDAGTAFEPGPGFNVAVDGVTGGAWFSTFPGIAAADSHAAFAGDDLKVLVAQFTTFGEISGQIQVQVFEEGDQGQEFRDLLPICPIGVCGGCTDEYANNYNPDALFDDGSCMYDVLEGCTDEFACNFDATANVDDGSCEFDSCQWCDDPEACNYEGEGLPWTVNSALCEYLEEDSCDCEGNVLDALGVCGGTCAADEDGDGVCDDEDACIGVVDACGVCNGPGEIYECGCFDIPESDCDCGGNQLDALGVCGGPCLLDADNDGWCDECEGGDTEGYEVSVEEVVSHESGSLAGQTTYRVYLNCLNENDFVSACSGDDQAPFILQSSSGAWYNDPSSTTWNAQGINSEFLSFFPDLAFDSFLTIGAEDASTPAAQHPSTVWGTVDASAEFVGGPGSNFVVDDATGGAWYSTFPGLEEADSHAGFAGEDLRVLLMQITTAGTISGQVNIQIFKEGDQLNELRTVFTLNGEADPDGCGELDPCDGLIDECGVCNGPGAIFECGCTVLPQGDCDCDGNQLDALGVCGGDCVEDNDGDGVCDLLAEGCTDVQACNYIDAVEDNGLCEYPEEYYNCFGECLLDADADGVCDELEVAGCMDDTACNYDAAATDDDGGCLYLDACGECGGTGYLACIDEAACNYDAGGSCDDGSCTYPELYLECDGSCTNDADGDGVCDELEIVGCQDETACNYNAAATDAGECEYAEQHYDCDGNCLTDTDGDGVCDELEIPGCTDDTACNYDPAATEADNGSCEYAAEYYDCAGNCLMDTDGDGVCDELEVEGCTDSAACNYDAAATEDDDSCEYAGEYYDCAGDCLSDSDADGVCDELEVEGCQDETACNYNALATDAGDCEYAAEFYGCDGNCLNDGDGDGVCDELEVEGCQDETACNYDELATDEGECEFAAEFYDCDGNCLNDGDGDGVCDEYEIPGCIDETACNFDSDATEDDGSCEYAAEFYDCDGNCLNDADGDGVCDELEVDGCTDDTACNFNPDATEDDATCTFPGDACDDGDDTTINDVLNDECECVGEVDGLDEATALSWTLYPSPVRDVLNLRLEGGAWSGAIDGDVEVMVLGATGQVLRSERLAGRTQLDVSDFASGVYFLTLRSPAMATTTRRFVVAGGE